jgi:DNA-directed RNA polymerase specialized sigma24 family protein
MPVDHFPSTHATWIDAQLTIAERAGAHTDDGRSAQRALQQHLMQRYHLPLRAYVRGSSMRQLGDADDLVAGFFADRVGAPGFLADWRGSGMPLRRWLMNGISFYARGVMRDRARDRMRQFEDGGAGISGGAGDLSTHAGGEDRLVDDRDAARAFEEAWALEVLNAAHELVHADLAERGKLAEYDVFRRHVIDGVEYAVIGTDLGLTRQQCANMVRRVSDRIREALREVVRGEGVPAEEVERTVREVEELLRGG